MLGTRGAVLHHSAETVLCFRIHVLFVFVSFFLKYQQHLADVTLVNDDQKTCYAVERASCAFSNLSCYYFQLLIMPKAPFSRGQRSCVYEGRRNINTN